MLYNLNKNKLKESENKKIFIKNFQVDNPSFEYKIYENCNMIYQTPDYQGGMSNER